MNHECCICGDSINRDESPDSLVVPSNKYGNLWFCPDDRKDGGFMKHIWHYKQNGRQEEEAHP